MWLSVGFEDEDPSGVPASPDSTPLDLSPSMAAESPPDGGKAGVLFTAAKADPDQMVCRDPDPERLEDREAVALAMVTDLNNPTGVPLSIKQDGAVRAPEIMMADTLGVGGGEGRPTTTMMMTTRKKQRKRPREDEKICLVCGDKALAHNFDAITCESCKAFFRRNANRMEGINCVFQGECEISITTRRFCSACRLRKCFTVGMKADLILDDTERRARMEKVSENRAKRLAKDVNDFGDAQVGSTMISSPDLPLAVRNSTPTPSTPLSTVVPTNGRLQEGASNTRLQPAPSSHKSQQQQQQQRRKSVEASRSNSRTTLHDVLTAASALVDSVGSPAMLNVPKTGCPQSILNSHQAPKSTPQPPQLVNNSQGLGPQMASLHQPSTFQHVPRDLLPSDPHMYWRLSEEEKTLLTQLSSAYQATIMTLPERVSMEGAGLFQAGQGHHMGLASIEHIFETAEKNMRQLINFVQRLGDFQMLREDDKIAMLQASCMRSMILRWTGLYVVERHTWLTQFGECSVIDTCQVFGQEDVIQELAAFCQAMKTILKNDVTLFVLTHCLVLFDAREPNLVDRQLINSFRDKYLILLKHYLESEYSFLFTQRYLQALMDKIWEIRRVADRCMGIMKEFQDYIPPLTKQLLNLQEVM